jgi:hypothetical protein|tara:strand:+ start:655 stop:789 length:135 start_codon:yes stop_codon:yes gene_type:complete
LVVELVQVAGGIFQQRFVLLFFCKLKYIGKFTKTRIETAYCQDN